ncbi:hypothetical protein Cgig2_011345 [Carnegiea gigantea]|uniref:Protein-serine/threonine kinase n=1 Tax=Carnegiea gigantea TaxID=171969 RepID=A0A9Q1JTU0_9CARY|nr:hypothetical protein Cgig2_011345 [Carnegiea gigantea]
MAARKLADHLSKNLVDEVHKWGSMKQTGITLKNMMEFGSKPTDRNLLIAAQFLHKELPIRIGRRVIELENLPFGLSEKPAVLKVRDWYLDSFRDIRSFPEVKNNHDELEFNRMLQMIKVRHNNVVPMMALGVKQLKKTLDPKIGYEDVAEIHRFLDRFYMSRIGIRMLIGQHVALHDANPLPDQIGYIHTKMSPVEVARNAGEDARAICLRHYGCSPAIDIYGDPTFTFPYVPPHLQLMVFELVKNSLRAVQERYMDSDKEAPPIRIIVADGIEDVTIKACFQWRLLCRLAVFLCVVTDVRKGGLHSSDLITAENALNENIDLGTGENVTMAGYGYGLPISRLYARYFGGDLQIISMEGYGEPLLLDFFPMNFQCYAFNLGAMLTVPGYLRACLSRGLGKSRYGQVQSSRDRCLSSLVSAGGFSGASALK